MAEVDQQTDVFVLMQSFLSDDDNVNLFEDTSWLETEELTNPFRASADGGQGLVLHNTTFSDDTSDHEQYEMQGGGELARKQTTAQTILETSLQQQ